jgi:hypothetical protein
MNLIVKEVMYQFIILLIVSIIISILYFLYNVYILYVNSNISFPSDLSKSVYGTAESLPRDFPESELKNIKLCVFMVATPEIENYSKYTIEVNQKWAHQFGYDFFVFDNNHTPDLPINFSKIKITQDLLNSGKYTHVMHIDADAIITKFDYDVRNIILAYNNDFIVCEDCYTSKICPKPGRLNSGVYISKNSIIGREIIDLWLDSARGKCAQYAKMSPNCQLVFTNCVYPIMKKSISIIPFNMMNGYRNTLFIRHVMAKESIERVDEIKQLYQTVKNEHFNDYKRIKVW